MIVVRMLLSGEIRTVSAERAKQLIESSQAVPVSDQHVRKAVIPGERVETRGLQADRSS